MDCRTQTVQVIAAMVCTAMLQGCSPSGETEPTLAALLTVAATPPPGCPAERIATVSDLHTPGGLCATVRENVDANLKSHHYRVACEAIQGTRPARVDSAQATACREDDRGAWTDVEICCPAQGTAPEPITVTTGLTRSRRFRLEVAAPAVGQYGTASISLLPPPRPTEYHVRIAAESCDVYQLHPDRSCETSGSYAPGETSTFMVGYTPGSTHRRGGVLVIDFVDPEVSDVEVRLSGGVGDQANGWLSVPIER